MSSGAKIFWSFLGGAIIGAVGVSYLNRNKMDFGYMKPMATEWLAKGINLKDNLMTKAAAMKEDCEDMMAEARDRVDQEKMEEAAREGAKAAGK